MSNEQQPDGAAALSSAPLGGWQLVPLRPTPEMCAAFHGVMDHDVLRLGAAGSRWAAMLAAAPEPPHMSMSAEEARTFQDWASMDGATAFHLIERHANGWGDVARMMDAWLEANRKPPNPQLSGGVAVRLSARLGGIR